MIRSAFQILNNKIENRPLKLTIGLTYLCQSRCTYCDIWKFYQQDPNKFGQEIKKETYMQLFDDLKNDLIWLEFTGGEPFLRHDLTEIIDYAFNNTKIVTVGITTNALSEVAVIEKTKKIISSMPRKKEFIIGVSLDGESSTYKASRGLDRADQVLSVLLKLMKMKEDNPSFYPHIAYTISRYNAGKFLGFYEKLNRLHGITIEDFSFTFEHFVGYYYGNYYSKDNLQDLYATFREGLMKDLEDIRKIRKGSSNDSSVRSLARKKFYDSFLDNIPNYLDNPTRQLLPCKASKLSAYIDPYGDVHPCTMWKEVIGNIKTSRFNDIWNSEKNTKIRDLIKEERCPNCWTPCEAQPTWIGNLPMSLAK